MAEVILHEHADTDSGSEMGMLVGAILVVLLLSVLFFWGLPLMQGGSGQTTTPGVNVDTPQVQTPET